VRRLAFGWSVVIGLVIGAQPPSTDAVAATVSLDHGVLSYTAAPGERNEPYVSVRRLSGERGIEVRDHRRVRLVAGTGCIVAPDPDRGEVVRCSLASGAELPRVRMALRDAADAGTVERLLGRVAGGPGNDRLTGTGLLDGGPGGDSLTLTRGAVRKARGGSGHDTLEVDSRVTAGTVLAGGRGSDRLSGGAGGDVLRGGPGDDNIGDFGEERDRDVFRLGPGSDEAFALEGGVAVIFARDGEHDEIECGFGRQTLILDGLDFYEQEDIGPCERIRRRGPPRALPDTSVAYLEYDFGAGEGPNELEVDIICPYDLRPCRGTFTVYDRQGAVVKETFRYATGGRISHLFRRSKRMLRRLAKWARITVVSYDPAGGVHRHSLAGPNVVVINVPGEP
jgi:hypothetical protein